jgi:hypothetical protein
MSIQAANPVALPHLSLCMIARWDCTLKRFPL